MAKCVKGAEDEGSQGKVAVTEGWEARVRRLRSVGVRTRRSMLVMEAIWGGGGEGGVGKGGAQGEMRSAVRSAVEPGLLEGLGGVGAVDGRVGEEEGTKSMAAGEAPWRRRRVASGWPLRQTWSRSFQGGFDVGAAAARDVKDAFLGREQIGGEYAGGPDVVL